MRQSLVILGLGNTILSDDGAGIYVAREINKRLSLTTNHCPLITVKEASLGGFSFIDLLCGFERAVIVDAIHTKNGRPGEFYELDISALKPSARLSSLHGIDLATACKMASDMKIPFPKEVRIFAMEVEDEFTFSENCTPHVAEAIPKMAGFIAGELRKSGWLNG